MRDRKYFFLLILVLIIITVSFVLISMWGYHFYYSGKNDKPLVRDEIKAMTHKNVINDSLKYDISSLNEYSLPDNSDFETDSSGDSILIAKVLEYRTLRSEIAEILRKKHSEKGMSQASQQILDLQKDVEELKNKNDTIIQENERLNNLVTELLNKKEAMKSGPDAPSVSKKIEHSTNKLPVLVSHLRFAAYDADKKHAVTNVTTDAERLTGSFQVNIKPYNSNNSIYVVVIQPNGKVLSAFGSTKRTFISQGEKKLYSAVIHFDNKKDNGSRVSFSIDIPNLQKGKYVMQVYHQGLMIGRLTRTLF